MFDLDAELEAIEALDCVVFAVGADHPFPVIHVKLAPPEPFRTADFPEEWIRIEVQPRRKGGVKVKPIERDDRRWRHMFSDGSLCMWHPKDPPALRWLERDGLPMLVQITSRHLVHEEYFRRFGVWPVEECPHPKPGHNRLPRPVLQTPAMRQAAKRRWR